MNIDKKFLEEVEGNTKRGVVPRSGTSGVTVGMGFDIGNFGDIDVLGFSENLKSKLEPYVGLKGDEARAMLTAIPLQINDEELERVNNKVLLYNLARIASLYDKATGRSWCDLTEAQRTVIFSILHQYGRPERVPKFWGYVVADDWEGVYNEVSDFGDSFPTRRNKEARLLRPQVEVEDYGQEVYV